MCIRDSCRHVTVNDLGQLTVKAGDTERLVETAKLMVRVVQPSDLKVLDCIDGLEVCLKCECVCCKNQCLLYAAGLPQTVQVYTQILAGEHLMATWLQVSIGLPFTAQEPS